MVLRKRMSTVALKSNDAGVRRWRHLERTIRLSDSIELVAVVAASQNFAWRFVVLPSSLLLASGVATAIGLTFGVFPARAAAKMDPVTALRYNR